MRPELLHVVAVVSNPMRYASRTKLYAEFCQHMLDSGVKLTTVECALHERPFELALVGAPHVNFVGVRNSTIVWHKESLINIGFQRISSDAKYVAWIDSDITFRHPHWAAETVHALQQFNVIQPWTHAYDLGPNGEHMDVNTSFASLYQKQKPIALSHKRNEGPRQIYSSYHTGYAWAARRETLNAMGGLLELAPLGSADHNMAYAFMGRIEETFPTDVSHEYTAYMQEWQTRAFRAVNHRVGALPHTIEHSWHGPKKLRGYQSRAGLLRKHKFNPRLDLHKNLDGVIELSDNKPKFRHDIETYMASRNEDANTVFA